MLCSGVASSKIFLATPSPRRSYAPLRIFLPQLREALLQNPRPCGLRGRGSPLVALRQQGSRAVLVRLQRDHVEEKRLKASVPGVRVCASTNSLSAPSRSMAAPTNTMSSLIAAKSASARRNPPRNFESSSATRPLSIDEEIPWQCHQLVIGSGAYGRLPVMQDVQREAERRKIKLLVLPTTEAIEVLKQDSKDTNAILHVTC